MVLGIGVVGKEGEEGRRGKFSRSANSQLHPLLKSMQITGQEIFQYFQDVSAFLDYPGGFG